MGDRFLKSINTSTNYYLENDFDSYFINLK